MKLNLQISRFVLIAGLVCGAAAAHAATGFTVRPSDESKAAVGMTTAEVQQALGRPDRIVKYRKKTGQTWSYRVVGKSAEYIMFDVDFDAAGKVKSVGERLDVAPSGASD